MKKMPPPAPKGRPRAFDPECALQKALELFWRQGYEGTSLSDLTAAMGINRPSLYAAFGNKEKLFRKALDRYLAGPAASVREALEAPTAREVAERLLAGAVQQLSDAAVPAGCLVVQAALTCGAESDPIRQTLADHRSEARRALTRRFDEAVATGDLPAGTNAADLAAYLMTVLHGLAVQSATGLTRAELRAVAAQALCAFPM
jgi:AcrR family transcriptional regulator